MPNDIKSNLEARHRLDKKVGGKWLDISGNGNDLTEHGDLFEDLASLHVGGVRWQAQVDEWMSFDEAITLADDFTVVLWADMKTLTNEPYLSDVANTTVFGVLNSTNLWIRLGSVNLTLTVSTAFVADSEYCIAIRRTDGVVDAVVLDVTDSLGRRDSPVDISPTGTLSNSSTVVIDQVGTQSTGVNWPDVKLDDIWIFSRALTDYEIDQCFMPVPVWIINSVEHGLANDKDTTPVPYRLFTPEGHATGPPLDLVVYCHGSGVSAGSDNLSHVQSDFPRSLIFATQERNDIRGWYDSAHTAIENSSDPNTHNTAYKSFILLPQFVGTLFDTDSNFPDMARDVLDLIRALKATYNIGKVRLMGGSNGGKLVHYILSLAPRTFEAAITGAPFSRGTPDTDKNTQVGFSPQIAKTYYRASHGEDDATARSDLSVDLNAALLLEGDFGDQALLELHTDAAATWHGQTIQDMATDAADDYLPWFFSKSQNVEFTTDTLLHLKFDETSGSDYIDETGNFTCTANAPAQVVAGSDPLVGSTGQSVDFRSGTGGFIDLDTTATVSGDFSLLWHFNLDDTVARGHCSSTGTEFMVKLPQTNPNRVRFKIGSTNYDLDLDSGNFDASVNSAIGFRRTGSLLEWFFQGVKQTSTATAVGDLILDIIGSQQTVARMNGRMDDFRLVTRALTDVEFAKAANNPYAKPKGSSSLALRLGLGL